MRQWKSWLLELKRFLSYKILQLYMYWASSIFVFINNDIYIYLIILSITFQTASGETSDMSRIMVFACEYNRYNCIFLRASKLQSFTIGSLFYCKNNHSLIFCRIYHEISEKALSMHHLSYDRILFYWLFFSFSHCQILTQRSKSYLYIIYNGFYIRVYCLQLVLYHRCWPSSLSVKTSFIVVV